jgi:preprotein translocase subunit SecG
MSTIFAPVFLAISNTLLGVLMFYFFMFGFVFLQSRGHAGASHTAGANMTTPNLFFHSV